MLAVYNPDDNRGVDQPLANVVVVGPEPTPEPPCQHQQIRHRRQCNILPDNTAWCPSGDWEEWTKVLYLFWAPTVEGGPTCQDYGGNDTLHNRQCARVTTTASSPGSGSLADVGRRLSKRAGEWDPCRSAAYTTVVANSQTYAGAARYRGGWGVWIEQGAACVSRVSVLRAGHTVWRAWLGGGARRGGQWHRAARASGSASGERDVSRAVQLHMDDACDSVGNAGHELSAKLNGNRGTANGEAGAELKGVASAASERDSDGGTESNLSRGAARPATGTRSQCPWPDPGVTWRIERRAAASPSPSPHRRWGPSHGNARARFGRNGECSESTVADKYNLSAMVLLGVADYDVPVALLTLADKLRVAAVQTRPVTQFTIIAPVTGYTWIHLSRGSHLQGIFPGVLYIILNHWKTP
ncbi:hypothetical protein GGX14DRAFT_582468 [Mycena pura]|uniref:Uncharacterized protein n=1 Tax=Mycena pura TaxID=153505 RepID=A0AAD6YUR5_9AGAR|nr:hypothetical protein GGX14DRAFT_582468 [Mycena pura]